MERKSYIEFEYHIMPTGQQREYPSYIGRAIRVFEGHPLALAAVCSDPDVLLVDLMP